MTLVIFPPDVPRIDLMVVAKRYGRKYRAVRWWHLAGVKTDQGKGKKVRLEVERNGQRLYTTEEALAKFLRAQNGGKPPPIVRRPRKSPPAPEE